MKTDNGVWNNKNGNYIKATDSSYFVLKQKFKCVIKIICLQIYVETVSFFLTNFKSREYNVIIKIVGRYTLQSSK